jgi:curved DNA-binding protein CbpA
MTESPIVADPYEVLQVQPSALPEVVRAAYRALAWKYHPDRGASSARMVAINDAWRILGNPVRRAAYDAAPAPAAPVPSPATRSTDVDVAPAREHGLASRRREQDQAGSVVDFGRYAGWKVGRLVDHDPDYLRWLARTPVGRRLAPEIDAALSCPPPRLSR